MSTTNNTIRSLVLLPALALVLTSTVALARPGQPGPGRPGPERHHRNPGPGPFLDVLPGGALTIFFGGLGYRFVNGLFYLPQGPGFAVVAPPVGLVVPVLPPVHTVVVVGGRTYYHAHDVYYMRSGDGYCVTPLPAAAPPAQDTAKASALPDTVTIILDNANGSRTPVTLKRTQDGWLGPKGELYDAIPTQDQLRPYYGLAAQSSGQSL